jgi:hypothetical protein
MKRVVYILLFFCLLSHAIAADVIVTKQNKKYHGTVIKITDNGFVIRTVDGAIFVLPKNQISKIIRNRDILDFDDMTRYYVEIRRPYLPFIVLGGATAAFAVKKYQDYKKERDRINEARESNQVPDDEIKDMTDASKRHLAWCIVSGLFSAGSFYIAFRPMEVKVPMGRINLSMAPNGVMLSMQF